MQDNTASTLFQIKIVSLRCMLECISNSAEENQAAQQNKSIILPSLPECEYAKAPGVSSKVGVPPQQPLRTRGQWTR